ncbi:hypothetical protein HYPSUDRAFT_60336, partial [Hypholoma sublateritium FD-334 SS-4]
ILGSDLSDSMIHGTGFGSDIIPNQETTENNIQGLPTILVQVVALTEVAQPHGNIFLKFRLSDGENIADAIMQEQVANALKLSLSVEHGSKMVLFNPHIRHGVLILEVHNVVILGGSCPDLKENQTAYKWR